MTEDKLTTLFCFVDDFCLLYENIYKKQALESGKPFLGFPWFRSCSSLKVRTEDQKLIDGSNSVKCFLIFHCIKAEHPIPTQIKTVGTPIGIKIVCLKLKGGYNDE